MENENLTISKNVPEEVILRLGQDMVLELKQLTRELFQKSRSEETTFADLEQMTLRVRQRYGEILLEKALKYSEDIKKKTPNVLTALLL